MIKDLARAYLEEKKRLLEIMPLEEFADIAELFLKACDKDRQIFVFGNGGSGSTASHFVCDLVKGVSYGNNKKFKAICLNDNIPVLLAYANDVSYEDVFVEQLKNFLKPGDIVIGISGSGKSKNVLKAISYSNSRGATSIGFTGFDGGELRRIAKRSIVIRANDMQHVEDMHLILIHMFTQVLHKMLRLEFA